MKTIKLKKLINSIFLKHGLSLNHAKISTNAFEKLDFPEPESPPTPIKNGTDVILCCEYLFRPYI